MSTQRQTITARVIQNLAERNQVAYEATASDRLAGHITRLAGDDVELDPIEQMLIGLQRAGRINRRQMVLLQARYLRESGSWDIVRRMEQRLEAAQIDATLACGSPSIRCRDPVANGEAEATKHSMRATHPPRAS